MSVHAAFQSANKQYKYICRRFKYAFRFVPEYFARGLIKNAITKREDNVEGRTTITVHDIQVQNLGYKVYLTQVPKSKNPFFSPPLLFSLLSQVLEISLPFSFLCFHRNSKSHVPSFVERRNSLCKTMTLLLCCEYLRFRNVDPASLFRFHD